MGSDPPRLLFLSTRDNFDHPDISDGLLFLSVSRKRTKTKKQKETTFTTGFNRPPHSFFSKSTGKNGQVVKLDLAGFACNLHTFD